MEYSDPNIPQIYLSSQTNEVKYSSHVTGRETEIQTLLNVSEDILLENRRNSNQTQVSLLQVNCYFYYISFLLKTSGPAPLSSHRFYDYKLVRTHNHFSSQIF